MARLMMPFRRAFGFGFDTQAFISDRAYAQIILAQSLGCPDPKVVALAQEIALLMNLDATISLEPHEELPSNYTQDLVKQEKEDEFRAKLLRKYQSGPG
jgi:hypothetical protein